SGVNLVFFKTSEHSIVVLHTREGPVGQLLAFKSRMFRYADKIEAEIIKLIPDKKEQKNKETVAVSAERIPVLTVSIDKKKFPMDEASILHKIDSKKTISEICEITKIPRLKVNEILKKYQKKGWVKLKRVIGGKVPTSEKVSAEVIVKEIKKSEEMIEKKPAPPIKVPSSSHLEKPAIPFIAEIKTTSPTKSVIEKKEIPEFQPESGEIEESDEGMIYNFPIQIIEEPKLKMSKNEQKILKMCDGRNTVEDICSIFSMNKVELMSILRKFQKKGIIKLTRIIPSAMEEAKEAILEKEAAPIEESNEQLVGKLDKLIEKVEKKIEIKLEDKKTEEFIEEPPPEETLPEELMVADEEFEETLSDLENLLEKSEKSAESSEIQSFNDAIDELTGLLNDTGPKEKSTKPINLEQPISKPAKNVTSTPSIPSESEVTPSIQVELEAVPKISGAQVVCSHCQAALPSTKRICPQCGNPVKICPHCSAPISIHTRICPECSGIISK
ncbi:MAG: zinc ribbon domain-containing protein, partial [Promethearchaeota archaeon]